MPLGAAYVLFLAHQYQSAAADRAGEHLPSITGDGEEIQNSRGEWHMIKRPNSKNKMKDTSPAGVFTGSELIRKAGFFQIL